MKSLVVLLGVIVLSACVCAWPLTASCTFRSPAGFEFDFSQVDTNNGSAWQSIDATGQAYSWHICSDVTGVPGCIDSAVCQQPNQGASKSCGKLDTQLWSVSGIDDGSSSRITYTNGTFCSATGKPRQTTLSFRCAPGPATVVGSVEESQSDLCNYLIYMQGEPFCGVAADSPHDSDPCRFTSPSGWSYDISKADTNDGLPWSAVDQEGNDFMWHLCSAETNVVAACADSPMCQKANNGNSYGCGSLAAQQWSLINENDKGAGVKLTYANGSTCASDTARSTTFELYCSDSNTTVVGQVTEPTRCTYSVAMMSHEFCGSKDTPQ